MGFNDSKTRPVNVLRSGLRETSWAHQNSHFPSPNSISKVTISPSYSNKFKTTYWAFQPIRCFTLVLETEFVNSLGSILKV